MKPKKHIGVNPKVHIPQQARKGNSLNLLKNFAKLEMENEEYSGKLAIKTLERVLKCRKVQKKSAK